MSNEPKGLKDFIKRSSVENTSGALGKAFLGFDIANLVTSQDKLGAIWQLIKDVVLLKPVMSAMFVGMFSSLSKGFRSLVHDTGSLEAAIKKLNQIQGLKKVFAPLVGGIEAAKLKVAELVNYAASRNIELGGVAEAERSLQVFTRGAFAGSAALDVIRGAAMASGNSMAAVADEVGKFNAMLRGGESIAGAAQGIAQMGAISQATAQELARMQSDGASASQVFDALTAALGSLNGQAKQAAGGVEAVNAAFENAKANLQEKFGDPFTKDSVENTKRMTEALLAITPTVERMSKNLSIAFNGLGTIKNEMIAAAAKSDFLKGSVEAVSYALTGLVAVVSALSTIGLSAWLMKFGKMLAPIAVDTALLGTRMSALSLGMLSVEAGSKAAAVGVGFLNGALKVLKFVLASTGILATLAIAGTAYGIWREYADGVEAADKALADLRSAHDQEDAAMRKQIDAIKTQTELRDALVASIKEQADAQIELNKAKAGGDPAKIAEAESNLLRKRTAAAKLGKVDNQNLEKTEEERQQIRNKVARDIMLEEQQFQNSLDTASPEEKLDLMQKKIEQLNSKAAQAKSGEDATVQNSKDSDEASKAVAVAQAKLDALEKENKEAKDFTTSSRTIAPAPAMQGGMGGAYISPSVTVTTRVNKNYEKEIEDAKAALKKSREARDKVGSNAPEGTSVRLDYESRNEKNPEKRRELEERAERARALESKRSDLESRAQGMSNDQAILQREMDITQKRSSIEREIAQLKAKGLLDAEQEADLRMKILDEEVKSEISRPGQSDQTVLDSIAAKRADLAAAAKERSASRQDEERDRGRKSAELKNNIPAMVSADDMDAFAQKRRELIGLGYDDQNANQKAAAFARDSIAIDARNSSFSAQAAGAASSLARIGGGGNIEGVDTSDKALTLAQRQADFQEQMTKYLKVISESGSALMK